MSSFCDVVFFDVIFLFFSVTRVLHHVSSLQSVNIKAATVPTAWPLWQNIFALNIVSRPRTSLSALVGLLLWYWVMHVRRSLTCRRRGSRRDDLFFASTLAFYLLDLYGLRRGLAQSCAELYKNSENSWTVS